MLTRKCYKQVTSLHILYPAKAGDNEDWHALVRQTDLDASSRNLIIIDRATTRQLDLLVCAGWSAETRGDVKSIAGEIQSRGSSSYIIVESQFDRLPGDNGEEYHIVYMIDPKGDITTLGRQIFVSAKQIQGKEGQDVLEDFDATLPKRQASVQGRRLISLCCGEINIMQGRKNPHYMSSSSERAIDSADIIINPTHDRMGNHGTLIAKRERFSKPFGDGNRIYVSASNWDHAGYAIAGNTKRKRHKQRPEAPTLHTIFFNGKSQDMDRTHREEGRFEYREWEEPSIGK